MNPFPSATRSIVLVAACIAGLAPAAAGVAADGGFNAFLASQQRQPGTASLSLILFNHRYERVCENVPVDAVEPLSVIAVEDFASPKLFPIVPASL